MCVCVRGSIPEHIILSTFQGFGWGTRQKREAGKTGQDGAAGKSWSFLPCLLCLESFEQRRPTRLWSRVIGGAGCCPACKHVQASLPPVQP